jgi:PQQ-dependent dehydrogenase (methanol/ethanol family)
MPETKNIIWLAIQAPMPDNLQQRHSSDKIYPLKSAAQYGLIFAFGFLFLFLQISCGGNQNNSAQNPPESETKLPSGASSSEQPEDGQWLMSAKNYANTRFSGLDQINTQNASNLKVAWTFSTGINRGQEAAPIVVGETMYLVTPFPNILYALDLKNGGTTKWKYEPKPESAAQGVACCDVVNRGAAYSNGKVFINTLDGQTCAVDAATGKELWKTKLGDINLGETITMAPLVVKDKVLVGNSGGEMGVRGWLTALDANSGKIVWKAFSTGPDKDVLIGQNFKPFYDSDKGTDLGVSTWNPDQWKIGGGNVWGFLSYDPESNLIFYGTANPGVWNPELRPGDNKWSCGIFARNPDTGEAVWFYQLSPHDLFDHDGVNENVLVDLPFEGQTKKVILHPDRNGYMYVLDRSTGQVLSATPFVYITGSKGVDLQTGRLIENEEKKPQTGKVIKEVCPSSPGAKDWNPSAFSPRTGLLYLPHNNLCMDYEGIEANYIAGTPYVGVNAKYYAGPGGNRGFFTAWNPVEKKAAWQIKEKFPVWSGALVTAGDVVFYGTMDGWFKALDAKTGNLLWQFKTGSGIIGQPITFRTSDGKQYVAILSGIGGWAGSIVSADLDPRDETAANGWGSAVPDLKDATTKGGTLYVFALP